MKILKQTPQTKLYYYYFFEKHKQHYIKLSTSSKKKLLAILIPNTKPIHLVIRHHQQALKTTLFLDWFCS